MPPKSTKKRKSDAQDVAEPSKKARTSNCESQPDSAAKLVDSILANKQGFTVPDGEDNIRETLIMLADYALQLRLENAKHAAADSTSGAPPKKTREDLEAAVQKLRKAIRSGICKMMTWKPSCKSGTAKFVYNGACADPEVFGIIMGLDGPPTWKMKRLTLDEFKQHFGQCEGSARFSSLYITGKNVIVRYSDGEFKISGTYGKFRYEPE